MAGEFVDKDYLVGVKARGRLRQELGVEAEDATDGSGGSCSGRWMGGVAVLASDAVGAGATKLAVEGDVGAGKGAEGEFPGREVGAEVAIGRVAEVDVELFGGISSRSLLGIDMGDGECGREGSVVVVCVG